MIDSIKKEVYNISVKKGGGSSITAVIRNTGVRKKEIIAKVTPSFSAVKKEEPYMAHPMQIKDSANTRKPETVSSVKAGS